jgi:thiol-disulfide isomerase/thioredoxin
MAEGRALAQGIAFQASPDPALAPLPRAGDLMLNVGQGAALTSARGWMGAVTPGATWGPSLADWLLPFKLRLELPIIEERRTVQPGSILATLNSARSNFRLGPVTTGFAIEVGVLAPSLGGETLEVAGNALAEHDAHAIIAGSIPVTVRALGLTAVLWSTPFALANVELDYATRSGAVWLRAGAGLPVGGQPLRWFGGVATQLARGVAIGASASAESDPSASVLCELSVRWSTPWPTTETVPWQDADARVLHADDVQGRDVEMLAVPGKHTIIELGATWCVPCREARPALRRLARRPDVAVRFVDVDECPVFAARYDGTGMIPMFIVLDPRGVVVRTVFGAGEGTLGKLVPP